MEDNKLKAYEEGFTECQKMCKKIVKECSVDGTLDIIDSANFLIEKFDALVLEGEQDE